MRFIKIWLLLVVIVLAGGLFYFSESFTANSTETVDNTEIGGPFSLTDQHGKKISDQNFKGKFMLIYFGFTNCPGTCPVDMAAMTEALKKLGDNAKKIAPIFITIDPKHDTPQHLTKYLKNYYPAFTGLTGTEAELTSTRKEYKVFAEESAAGVFNHSSHIYLMDKDGKYLTHFDSGIDAGELATKIKEYL